MRTTIRSRVLLSTLVALAFCAVLFYDIFVLAMFIVICCVLAFEAIPVSLAARRPEKRFKIEKLTLENKSSIYPGEELSGKFTFEKKWRGQVELSTESNYLKLKPSKILEGSKAEIEIKFKTPFAGEYYVKKLGISLSDPVHLFSTNTSIEFPLKFTVFPRAFQVATLSSRLLGKSGIGETPIDKPGIGTEFHDMREYQVGDDYKNINWKATARRGELIVNEKMKEVGGSYYIVLDARARDDFERDRLATSLLTIANTLTMSRSRFGIIVHNGDIVINLHRISAPEDSLSFALGVSLDYVKVRAKDLPEELSSITSYMLRSYEKQTRSSMKSTIFSDILRVASESVKAQVASSSVFSEIFELAKENAFDPPMVVYVSSLVGSLAPVIEMGYEVKQFLGSEFLLVDPAMPWVAELTEIDAYEAYVKFASKLKSFANSKMDYATGDPVTIVGKL